MSMWRATDARFSINGTFFPVRRYSQRTVAPEVDVSNTESIPGNPLILGGVSGTGGPCRSFIGDIMHTELTITTASYDDERDPMTGFGLVKGEYALVSWFPAGANGTSYGPWNMLVTEVTHDGEVGQGAQPVSIKLLTDGEFNLEPY